MTFSLPPKESRKQVNKAGQVLVLDAPRPEALKAARNLAERWRACHAYPINTFQATLRRRLKHYKGDPIAAQRLKRMPTIIGKMKIYKTMQLTEMQDIGGLRAILQSVSDVDRLASEYRDRGRLDHQLINEKDYIRNPRNEDGYRSLHLIYRYRNKSAPKYNNLKLELQIRTKLQHTWATAVETMDTITGQRLKSRMGDQDWQDFFAIVSCALAHRENCPPLPRFANLSEKQTLQKLATAEAQLGALDMMSALSAAANAISRGLLKGKGQEKAWSYHLIILDSNSRTVKVSPYDRESLEQALSDYTEAETRATKGEKIEPVLVSAGPIAKLRRAYPNFFLDIGEFVRLVRGMIPGAKD